MGMHAQTGRALDGDAHILQSVRDILTTPLGSRIMNREYGSRVFELIDRGMDPSARIDFTAATAEALALHEPRVRVERVQISSAAESGQLVIALDLRKRDGAKLQGTVAL